MGEMTSFGARRIVSWIIGAALLACSETTAPGPSAPDDVVASLATPTSVHLTWSSRPAAEKVTSYAIYRNGSRIAETTDTTFTDSGLVESVTLSYSVSSIIESGYESSQSAPVSITTRDVIPPKIVQYLPLSSAGPVHYDNVTVRLVFSEAMDSTSFNNSTFAVTAGPSGPQIEGAIAYYKNAYIAEFRGPFGRMPAATTIFVKVSGLKDMAGNPMTSALTFSFNTTENVPPFIVSTVPVNNATEVPLDAEVRITFSEPMSGAFTRVYDLSSNLPSDFVQTTDSWDAAMITQTLKGHYKSNHRYLVIVGRDFPAKDVAGNPLTGPNSFGFTTLDADPPRPVSVFPEKDAIDVDPATQVRITFNEPLDVSTVTAAHIRVYGFSDGGSVAGALSYDQATYTVTFTPSSPLTPTKRYVVEVHDVKDASGYAQEEYFFYSFTTK